HAFFSVGRTDLWRAAPCRACVRIRSRRIASVRRFAASLLPAGPPTLRRFWPLLRCSWRTLVGLILHSACPVHRLILPCPLSHHNNMLFKTRSAAVYGIEAYLVDVEVNISTGGNGQFLIVGLPDTAVRESRNRVIAAIRNNGFGSPYQYIVINLAPADVKKEGSAFDLPMAVGILGGYGLLAKHDLSDYLMVGELSLDGKLRPVKGVLSIAMLARERKIPHLLVPVGNAREAAVVEGVAVYPVRTLAEVVAFINGNQPIDPARSETEAPIQE